MSDQLRCDIEDHGQHHDNFVASQPAGLIYCSGAYLRMVGSLLEAHLKVMSVYIGTQLACIMPIVVKTSMGVRVVNSLPFFGSHGGPLVDFKLPEPMKASLVVELVDEFEDFCAAEQIDSATLVTNPFGSSVEQAALADVGFEFSLERVGQFNRLPQTRNLSKEAFLATLTDPRVRGSITKAINSGVVVTVSEDWSDYNFLYETHRETMTAKGVPYKDLNFFEYVYSMFPRHMRQLYVAKIEGQRVAALLNLYYKGYVEYFVPVTAEGYRIYQPNSLLIFEAMYRAVLNGSKVWNWGGSGDGSGGVYDFKRKWGAEDHKYIYLNRVYNPSIKQLPSASLANHFKYFFIYPF